MADKLTKESHPHYENNPFFVVSNGITLLFNLARGVAILLLVVSILGLFSNSWSPSESNGSWENLMQLMGNWTATDWILAVGSISVILLAIMMVSALFGGVSTYTSAQLVHDKKVELRVAFHEAFEHLWSYLWLQVIITVKVFLWMLLLIVPGVIMAVRYSLAGVAFFDEKKQLRGNAAIKESLRLTNGAWITTYASSTLFNILTLGAINSVVTTSANTVLYKQFDKLGDHKKPAAHWLSWVTLLLPAVFLAIILLLVIAIGIGIGLSGNHFS
ncbi:MAG: hypothetical protein JWN75_563 [Candidatus Saccharibacteria bacterium]|nr:hypothetical protein [Candidatus Saccharibacteria bacterium]